jgi:hypothetical protein
MKFKVMVSLFVVLILVPAFFAKGIEKHLQYNRKLSYLKLNFIYTLISNYYISFPLNTFGKK